MQKKRTARICFLALVCLVCVTMTGCAQYRVIELERFSAKPGSGSADVTTYAATRNNMIIPEYVIDRQGGYPTEYAVAEARLRDRKHELNALVREKYAVEPSVSYQTKRVLVGIGQVIVAPVVLLVMYVGDLYNREKTEESSHLTKHYLRSMFQNQVPQKPVIRESYGM